MKELLPNISFGILILLVIFSLVRWRVFNDTQKLISVVIYVVFLTDLITKIIKVNDHWVYHISVPLQFMAFGYLYYKQMNNTKQGGLIKVFVASLVLFSLLNTFFIDKGLLMPSLPIVLSCVLGVIIALMYFNSLLKEFDLSSLSNRPLFWFSLAIILYYPALAIFIGVFRYYMHSVPAQFNVLGEINALFYVFFTVLCAISLWVKPKIAQN